MSDTHHLGLPLIAPAQAQKHVTHNEALVALDALVHLACLGRDLSAPPVGPGEGGRYLVGPSPAGAWAGHAGEIAHWLDGAWRFTAPKAGFVAYLADEGALRVFDGERWRAPSVPADALQGLARLGIGTVADAANPFSAKINAALWTARPVGEGGDGDLRYTLNKESASDVLSLLFQSGYAGRAEIGLIGDDDLQLKLSGPGGPWVEAMRLKGSGKVGIGAPDPAERLTVAGNIALATDNAHSLGTPALRVSTVYAATGVINTSDERLKTDLSRLSSGIAADLLRRAPPFSFRWRTGGRDGSEADGTSVERAGRRHHLGWSAQDWRAGLAEADLDLGLLVSMDPNDPDAELGLRPDQIVAVLHAGLLGLLDDLEALKASVTQLASDTPGGRDLALD
jgi:hypothetical protein